MKGIIRRMTEVYRIYRMARLMDEETDELGRANPKDRGVHLVYINLLLKRFVEKYPKYTPRIATKTLAAGIANKYFVRPGVHYTNPELAEVYLSSLKGYGVVERIGWLPIGLWL